MQPEWQELATRLRPFIRSRVASEADADDVLQEVLLRMYRGIGRLEDEERLASWTYRIARNAVADHLRARARHPLSKEAPPEGVVELDQDDGVEQEVAQYVASFVSLLPAPYRDAITLTELKGMKQREAAEVLGISLSALKSRVHRGRARLRAMLEACCEIALDARNRIVGCEPRSLGDIPPDCC